MDPIVMIMIIMAMTTGMDTATATGMTSAPPGQRTWRAACGPPST